MHIDEELFKQDSFKKKLKIYEEAVREGRTVFMDIDDMTDIIDYYNYDGQVDDADRVANCALSLYPGAIGPLVFKARQAIIAGDYEAAFNYCESIGDKSDIDYFYLRLELLISQNKCDKADELIDQRLDETDPEERENFLLDIGALYIDYGCSEEGKRRLDMLVNKDTPDCIELLARVKCNEGEYDEAATYLNRLIDWNPFVCRYWNMLAMIQLCNNQYPECLTSAEYSLAITPNNTDGLWCKAKALLGQGEAEEAMEYYNRFLERLPDCARAEADKGACLMQTGDIYGALECLLNAEKHCDDDDEMLLIQVYDDLAFAYSNIRNIELALEYLDKAESLQSDKEYYKERIPHRMVLKGHILLQNDKRQEAEELYLKAMEMSDNDPEVMVKVMASLYDHQEYQQVVELFKKFEATIPEGWTSGYSYIAGSLIKTGNYKDGVEYLKKACMLNCNEVRLVFGDMFPPNMPCENYYEFIKNVKF